MSKKLLGIAVVVVFTVCVLSVQAHAYGKKGEKSGAHFSLEEKVMKKAHFLMENQEEIGLSDEQIEKVRAAKLATKKSLIKLGAEIELLSIDMKSMLYQEAVDVKALKKLVDKKYELKKEKTNMLIDAYVKIKGELTEDQVKLMKDAWKEKKKGWHDGKKGCPMMQK